MEYKRLKIIRHGEHVVEVSLNQPKKSNAMDTRLWREVGHFFTSVVNETACRCIILTGQGRHFSSGIDLNDNAFGEASSGGSGDDDDDEHSVAHAALGILRTGTEWQRAWSSLEECGRPVIAAIHGACIGAALELASATDIRLCTNNAVFAAPEVQVGIAADIGGLQRFPKIIGNDSLVRELMFTGRKMYAPEALSLGLVSKIHGSLDEMRKHALELAEQIANKSPVAIHGIKTLLNYTRDHSVAESLRYAMTWNMSMIQSPGVMKSIMAMLTKEKAIFKNLPALTAKSKL